MVYFDTNLIQIPRHFNENPTKMTLTNEVTNKVTEIDVVNVSENPRVYALDMSGVELGDGTYKYNLGSEVGLLQVGDYVATSTEYKEKINNKVYER